MNEFQRGVCKWAWDHIQARDFVVIDTETTGLDGSAEIVQIVVVNAWGRVAFSSLVKPSTPIDENGRAFEVHGISNAMLQHAPTMADIYEPLLRSISFRCTIAYNADFDRRIIEQALCYRHLLPALSSTSQWECAMKEYATFRNGVSGGHWVKLELACAEMGLSADRNWHDDAADALATYELIEALAARGDQTAEHHEHDDDFNFYVRNPDNYDDQADDEESESCPLCEGRGYIIICEDDTYPLITYEVACPECGEIDETSGERICPKCHEPLGLYYTCFFCAFDEFPPF